MSRKIPLLPDIGALGTRYGALLLLAAQRSRDFESQLCSVVLIRRNIGILLSDITLVLFLTHASMKTFLYPIGNSSTRKDQRSLEKLDSNDYLYIRSGLKKKKFLYIWLITFMISHIHIQSIYFCYIYFYKKSYTHNPNYLSLY